MPGSLSWLDPGGWAAARIAELWWIMLVAAVVVLVLVLATLWYALQHRGARSAPYSPHDDRGPTRWILGGGFVLPTVVLTPLLLLTLYTLGALEPPKPGGEFEIEVVGRQWWWDIRYIGADPSMSWRTANEIHLPVGQPIRVRLRSDDVIHSFWVPALQGKLDLIPGRTTTTWLQADTSGVFRGQCAEYCGLQHTRMALTVIAHPSDEFALWRARQLEPPPPPATPLAVAGQRVFLRDCALCHTVRGTRAGGVTGPDLTDLAARYTLAAGTLPNTRGHLAGWIGNPQALKPGNGMPRIPMPPADLHALLDYLAELR